MSKLVGDVSCELEDQKRLEFLGELEDLMMRYQISNVTVSWKFGTNFSLAEMVPPEIVEIEPTEKVVPRNVAISPVGEIPPKSGGFRKAGDSEPTKNGGISEDGDLGQMPSTLDVLHTVVGKMDQEEAEAIGEVPAESDIEMIGQDLPRGPMPDID